MRGISPTLPVCEEFSGATERIARVEVNEEFELTV
jgi:hypothetical protein